MFYNLKPCFLYAFFEPRNMKEFMIFLIIYVPFLIYAAKSGIRYLKSLKTRKHSPDPVREIVMWIVFIFMVLPMIIGTLFVSGFGIWISLGLPV